VHQVGNKNKFFFICRGQSISAFVLFDSKHNIQASMPCTSFIPSADKTEQTFVTLLWRVSFLSLVQPNEWHFSYHALLTAVLHWIYFVVSTIARLFSDTCFRQNVRDVGRMLWNGVGVKTCQCYGVSCGGAVIEFVSRSASASLLVESTSVFVLVGPTLPGVDCVWYVMAHAQEPYFGFRRNGRVHLNRRGRQFSRLLAAEVCASAVVMLITPCLRGSVKSTGYPLHSPVSPSLPLPCFTVYHHISTGLYEVQEMPSPSSVAEELDLASPSLPQGLEHRHCVLQDWEQRFHRE
jgi:hypothetical protein